MNGNSVGITFSPGGLAAAERSEDAPGESQRSAKAAKAGADSVAASRPDPESVRAGAMRSVQARTDAIRSQLSLLPLAQDPHAMKNLRVWLHLGASKIPERVIP